MLFKPTEPPLKRGLMRLFPKLQSIWGNTHYSSGERWVRDRRVCVEAHFDTYFRFSLSMQTVSQSDVRSVIENASNSDAIEKILLDGLTVFLSGGRTKTSYLLEEINSHASDFSEEDIEPFLATLFRVADQLEVAADEPKGFYGGVHNQVRIHWLLRNLTLERLTIEQRSEIFVRASDTASLGWLTNFAESAYVDHHPREGREPESPEKCLTTLEDAEKLKALALDRIRSAAADSSLIDNPELGYLLYRWRDSGDDDGREVMAWTDSAIENDANMSKFASVFLSTSWSHGAGFSGLGDLVSRSNDRAQTDSMDSILNSSRFRERLENFVNNDSFSEEDRGSAKRLLAAWALRDSGAD